MELHTIVIYPDIKADPKKVLKKVAWALDKYNFPLGGFFLNSFEIVIFQ